MFNEQGALDANRELSCDECERYRSSTFIFIVGGR